MIWIKANKVRKEKKKFWKKENAYENECIKGEEEKHVHMLHNKHTIKRYQKSFVLNNAAYSLLWYILIVNWCSHLQNTQHVQLMKLKTPFDVDLHWMRTHDNCVLSFFLFEQRNAYA